jgi:hypothetical protein
MTKAEAMRAMGERVVPIMQEFGLTAFVVVGYVETDEGLKRVCIANDGGNPAYQDGLRPVIHFSHLWAGSSPPPPPTTNPA